jgi:hypothetical protein
MTTRKPEILAKIVKEKALNDALIAELKSAAEEFKQSWAASSSSPQPEPAKAQPAKAEAGKAKQ